ncbi:MAG TPA: thioredoxin domain-containing protein [Nocardioides sp.]|uniref:DsbA family protein n=1 Tax=Nocardioides sp. TaxID=35761 RepID=UPI002EDACD5E
MTPAPHDTRRRNLRIGAVAAIVLVLAVVAGYVASSRQDDPVTEAAGAPAVGLVIGPDDADHRVVVYEDFLCPYCGELERQTSAELAELAQAGRVQVEYRAFQLLDHDYSREALLVYEVVRRQGDDAVAQRLHDLLFEQQPSESGREFPGRDELVALAVEAGADEQQLRDTLETAQAGIWADEVTEAAQDAGVMSTPTLLLDGKEFTDGRTVDELAENLLAAVR